MSTLDLRSKLADFLDYLAEYDESSNAYNRILTTLESIIKTIVDTLSSNRNSYPDIKSNVDMLKEKMNDLVGYQLLKSYIDKRFVYLDSVLNRASTRLIKSRELSF